MLSRMPKKSNIIFTNTVKKQNNVVRKDELLGEPVPFRQVVNSRELGLYANKGLRYAMTDDGRGTRLTSLLELERFAANYEDKQIVRTRKVARRINRMLEYMNVPEIIEQFYREVYYLQFNPGKQWTGLDIRGAAGKTNWSPLWLKSLKRKLWKMSKNQ